MRVGRFAILAFVLLTAMLLLPPLLRHVAAYAARPDQARCSTNLKQLGNALVMYCQDYDEVYPPAGAWGTVMMPYMRSNTYFQCPVDTAKDSYAFNANLGNRPMHTVQAPAMWAALFESNLHVPNAVGRTDAVADPPRHLGWNIYAFADGHVKLLKEPPDFGNRYIPPPPPPSPFEREPQPGPKFPKRLRDDVPPIRPARDR